MHFLAFSPPLVYLLESSRLFSCGSLKFPESISLFYVFDSVVHNMGSSSLKILQVFRQLWMLGQCPFISLQREVLDGINLFYLAILQLSELFLGVVGFCRFRCPEPLSSQFVHIQVFIWNDRFIIQPHRVSYVGGSIWTQTFDRLSRLCHELYQLMQIGDIVGLASNWAQRW